MPNAEKFAAPVPAAVKAIAARADQLQKDFINPPKLDADGKPIVENEEDVDEGNEPEDQDTEEGEQRQEVPQTPAQAADATDETWKHKFLSMQGRYNSEVPKLRDQIKAMGSEIGNLNKLLTTVRQPAPVKAEDTFKSSVTAEQVAEYGPELIELINSVVKDATAEHVKEINFLKGQLKQTDTQLAGNAREQLLVNLNTQVPDWEAINTSKEFVDWLALPDAYSGDIRHNMLKAAFEANNSPRVIAFFKGFLAELAAMAPAEEEPGKRIVPKTPLKSLAAPGRAKSTAAPSNAPAEKPIFTAHQIAQFYTDKSLGKWRGRENEAKELEAAIFLAQAEGRIQ